MIIFEVVGENLTNMLQACFAKLSEEKLVEFGNLKTDKERVSYALKTDFVHEIIEAEAEVEGKDETKAKELREEGNKFFQKKSYMSAIVSYNKCMRWSPLIEGSGDEEMEVSQAALAIGNRSAALFHLRRYEACLLDVQLALDEGFPVDMQYKLYDRQGKCHANLRQPEEAKNSFNRAMGLLEQAKLDEAARKNWTNLLNKQMELCEKITKTYIKSTKKKLPGLRGGHPNEQLLCASGLIELKHHEERRRYLAAKEKLRIGDVVMKEMPFSVVLMPDHYLTHCFHCVKRVELSPVPDTVLSNIVFCSRSCRQAAWDQYLKKEHKFLGLLSEEWCGRIGHLALRTALQMGFCGLLCYMIKAQTDESLPIDPLTRGFQGDNYSNDFHAIYNMETNIAKRLPEGLWDFAVYAVYLLKILQKMGYFDGISSKIDADTRHNEELEFVATALLRLLQVIQCNAVGIVELKFPSNFEDPGPVEIGMGLYTTAALFNHSCDPNADLVFYDNKLVVRITRNIEKGEDVNISYKVTYYKNVKVQRKGYLQTRYCFDCVCQACKEEWRHWRELESEIPFFKCSSCGKALPLGSDMVDKTHLRCKNKKCNNLQDLHELVGKMQVSHDIYAAAMQEATAGHYEVALPALIDHMILMQSAILHPFRDLASCQAAITQCYRMEGNTAV